MDHDAGGVDHHIHSAVVDVQGALDGGVDLCLVADVALEGHALAALCHDVLADLLVVRRVAAEDGHFGVGLGEFPCHALADALVAAGDDDHFSCYIKHISLSLFFPFLE